MPAVKKICKALTSVHGLRVFRKSADAHLPTRGSPYAAGYDLYASVDTHIPAKGGREAVETGIVVAIPTDTYARIAPRSGLAFKHGIDTGAGVILFNHGELILEKISTPEVFEVAEEELEETDRGAGGFGSTGVSLEKIAETAEAGVASEATDTTKV
ncbi:dUTP diphosphatase [Linderina pennispora]|uniref:dUTP diphosphatase n=1 Tax=Linderina pennispora TaxID=61395 RepID=A0A1Y1WLV3_9FUNG|nr:dUTP diphosphatase [Linderina pennispora]ORX74472.1 dUTP diphosphatase [Linderina pennispora]